MASLYEIQLTIGSAKDLKNVNWRQGSLRPYAVVWLEPNQKSSTQVDEEGDTSPIWDEKLIIPVRDSIDESTLSIDIVHFDAEQDTKPLIGSARLPLKEVIDEVGFGESLTRSLKLRRPSGRPQGKLEITINVCHFRYPTPASYTSPYGQPTSRDFLQPLPPYGYQYSAPPPPPPSGYPYYSQPPVYGQPPHPYEQSPTVYAQEEKKKNKYGMGTGLAVGAVAGVLGGLALAGGADYVEDKVANDVTERIEDDLGDDGDDF